MKGAAMKSDKIKLPDGRVLIKCKSCNTLRAHTYFLVGECNPKKKECWVEQCQDCRKSDDIAKKIGKPADAKWTDKAEDCGHCDGDGIYKWGAHDIITGRHQFSGKCFRCVGKGYQTWKDVARNLTHDEAQAAAAVRRDMGHEGAYGRAKQREEDYLEPEEEVLDGAEFDF
jgi:hypothetical protein